MTVSTLLAVLALAGTAGLSGTAAADHGNTSVTFDDQAATTSVVVSNVTLKNDGYVAVHDENTEHEYSTLGDSVIGVSEHLAPGNHRNVTVTLYADVPGRTFDQTRLAENGTLTAVLYGGTNTSEGNTTFNWITYRDDPDVLDSPNEYDVGNFNVVNDTAEVTDGNASASDGGDSDDEETTADEEETTADGETATDDAARTTAEGAPGFTALLAVVALLGAVLVAVRRA